MEAKSSAHQHHLNAVTYGNGQFFAVGSGFTILSSQHGLDWTVQTNGTDSSVLRAVTVGDTAVAGGGQLGAFLIPLRMGPATVLSTLQSLMARAGGGPLIGPGEPSRPQISN